ncbi:FtsK/SpoIIIE domain-containing protein [Streptomyces morookaense]|uniref:FtsK/SpoIIIE domain-containing protein n=1 Tax=Streptomyces morookaense TaxID=1970 RepID=UPI001E326099|nr:FtsK/SpoIIIE domain-containing protein [Streptomyces morookaense]
MTAMQIRLTVLGPLGGHTHGAAAAAHVSCDVLVTAPVGTALAGVASGLAAAVAAAGSDLGTGAVAVYAGTERLDLQRCALGEPPLIDGAVLSLNAPADPERHAGVLLSGVPESAARLHVVSGPDAGGVHLLHGGEVRVGRSSGADVPLDDPDVSRLHCAVTLSDDDGSITLHDLGSTNGTVLDGERVDGRAVPFPPGSLLRVGESTLILHAGPGDGAEATPRVLPASPDGEGHLRVGQLTSPGRSVKLPGQQGVVGGQGGSPLPHGAVRPGGRGEHDAVRPGGQPAAPGGGGAPLAGQPAAGVPTAASAYGAGQHAAGAPVAGAGDGGRAAAYDAGQRVPGASTGAVADGGQAGAYGAGQAPGAPTTASADSGRAGAYDAGHQAPGAPRTAAYSTGQHAPATNLTADGGRAGTYSAGQHAAGMPTTAPATDERAGAYGAGHQAPGAPSTTVDGRTSAYSTGQHAPGTHLTADGGRTGAYNAGPRTPGTPTAASADDGRMSSYGPGQHAPATPQAANSGQAPAHSPGRHAPTAPAADSGRASSYGPGQHAPGTPQAANSGQASAHSPGRHAPTAPAADSGRASSYSAGQHGLGTPADAGQASAYNAAQHAPGVPTAAPAPDGRTPAHGTGRPVPRVPAQPTGAGAAAAPVTVPPQAAAPDHPPAAGPTGYATGTLGPDGGTVRRPAPARSGCAGTVHGTGSVSFAPGGGHDDTGHETLGGRGLPLAVEAEAAADEAGPRRGKRGRGIGAWARRLTAGRGTAQRGSGEDPEADGPESEAEQALATAAALRERWPDPATVLLTALGPGPRLWERGPDHADLLTVRLGTADRGLLPSVPITVGLRQAGSLGLAGPRERLSGLARSVLAQLAALHRPATLEYVLISADRARPAEERLAEWSWLGWLPHARPAHGQDCRLLLAYDREQAEARTAELVRRLDDGPLGPGWATAPPEAVTAAARQHRGPHTVLVVDGDPGSPALRDTVARLAGSGAAAGIHVVCLAEAPATTPSSPVSATLATAQAASPAFAQCGAVALLSGDVATVVQVIQRAPAGSQGPVVPAVVPAVAGTTLVAAVDAVSAAWAERFARALAPLRMAEGTGADGGARVAAVLPRTARLLDELGLARATPASLTARWAAATDRGARPGGRAVAVLGAGPHGPLAVDLAGDGPHLLVEGGPGSGKTELLRSLAASLAAADRPDRLSLVLVDGAAAERGEGLRMCTDLPHVSTYLAASDPVRMREFAQALGSELKRRAELLGTLDFCAWHDRNPAPAAPDAPGVVGPRNGDLESPPSGTLKLRTQRGGPTRTAETALPRLVVLVDDFDALVAPALGSTGRPAAGSVVRALEAVARDGERLGVHLIAASGRPDRTADTAAVERAGLRATLEIAPAAKGGAGSGADGEPAPGRGRLQRPDDGVVTPFQAGRVTGRIPRTATLRPTVVTLDWQRMGDPPARRPVRELGNGPTDLALLASALQRAAQSAGVQAAPPLL